MSHLPGRLFHNNIDHLLCKMTELMGPADGDDPLGRLRIVASGEVRRRARFGDARDAMVDELRVLISGGRVSAYGTFSSHARPPGHFTRVYGTRSTLHVD